MDDWLIVFLKWVGQVLLTILATITAVVRWLNGRVTRIEMAQQQHGERLATLEAQHQDKLGRLQRIEDAIIESRKDLSRQLQQILGRSTR